jgi:hypothetical protein
MQSSGCLSQQVAKANASNAAASVCYWYCTNMRKQLSSGQLTVVHQGSVSCHATGFELQVPLLPLLTLFCLLATHTALLTLKPLPKPSCHTRSPARTPLKLSMKASTYLVAAKK